MPNINDLPSGSFKPIESQGIQPSSHGNINSLKPGQFQSEEDFNKDKYGTIGQQALTVAEGAGEGFLGPVKDLAESGLTKLGVPGLTPQDQEMRAKTNPVEHYGSQLAGFGAGALTGTGEAALLSKIGEGAIQASKIASPILRSGIKAGAEVAALQAGSEASKFINQDPNQTLGSAAVNIGLSGLIGGGAGVALGAAGSLLKGGLNKASKFIDDAKAQVEKRQAGLGRESVDVAPEVSQSSSEIYDPFTKQYKRSPQMDKPLSEEEFDSFNPAAGPKRRTLGERFGDHIYDKGAELLSKGVSKTVSAGVGSVAGSLLGHPLFGAYIGEKTLGPVIDAIAKPMLEGVTNPESLKASIDYVSDALRGQALLGKSAQNLFRSGEILSPSLLPTESSRKKLDKSLASLDAPDNMLNVGNDLAHYLPDHQVAVASLAATAKNYFDSIKPKTIKQNPLDQETPINPYENHQYQRALDIAQQPLMALKYAKDGTLSPADVNTLQTLYPQFHSQIVNKISDQVIEETAKGTNIPYKLRTSLSLLTGMPLDSTQTTQSMQAILASSGNQISQTQAQGQPKKASGTELSQINKVNKIYQTKSQSQMLANRA